MHDVQMQLQELKLKLDMERSEIFADEERSLVEKVETLKQEFRDLLIELRRRKAADVLSDDVSICLLKKHQKLPIPDMVHRLY